MDTLSPAARPAAPAGRTSLPRIICFHGGGSSAKILNIQTVRIQRLLLKHFRFVFVDGPFESRPGPGVSPFFDELGPFHRWTRLHPHETGEEVTASVEQGIIGRGPRVVDGMVNDQTDTGAGPIVGVMGFSQGAAVGAGLLLQQQRQNEAQERNYGLRFGIFCMSGYPLLIPSKGPAIEDEAVCWEFDTRYENKITIPSLHLHGLQDEFLALGRFHYRSFDPSTAQLIDMDLEHRMPISDDDNETLREAILDLYARTKPSTAPATTASA